MSIDKQAGQVGWDATLSDHNAPTLAPGASTARSATVVPSGTLTQGRATVLPPADPGVMDAQRYATVRSLGAGGMGEVALVRDLDIGRTVAVKRPLGQLDHEALHRFAREVRTVGKLEHPSIVPIHDVGIDESGRHYFTMKYVEGETLATIIERLAAGDPAYTAKYTFEYRTQIFTQLLYAVKYAHAQGVLHRDIKPMNVMVGPFGEVMLMDWGIARDLNAKDDPVATSVDGAALANTPPASSFATAAGTLLGSPAYMSPEQARGEIDKLDERSDIYSLCVLFHELITLKHYMSDKRSAQALLTELIAGQDPTFIDLVTSNANLPAELIHFLRLGLRRDPAKRYPTVDAMLEELASIRDNRIHIRCHITFLKRFMGGLAHAIDRHPLLVTMGMSLTAAAVLYAAGMGVSAALHGH